MIVPVSLAVNGLAGGGGGGAVTVGVGAGGGASRTGLNRKSHAGVNDASVGKVDWGVGGVVALAGLDAAVMTDKLAGWTLI